jgi:hypothetical protein
MEVAEVKINKKIIKTKRALRAIEIAKILFEDEGYHTRFLESLENSLKESLEKKSIKHLLNLPSKIKVRKR